MAKKPKPHLSGDDFEHRYEVIQNHLAPNAPYGGAWFETFGPEQEYISSIEPERIWTIIEGESATWIIAGRHSMNRLGYLITTKSWSDPFEEYRFE